MKRALSLMTYSACAALVAGGVFIAIPEPTAPPVGEILTAVEPELINGSGGTEGAILSGTPQPAAVPVAVQEGGVKTERAVEKSSDTKGTKKSSEGTKKKKNSKDLNTVYLDGLSAPLRTMKVSNGEIDPPDRGESVWLIDDYAAPSTSSHRNVYLVAHSGYGGKAVGDHLTDTSEKKSKLSNGDIITVRGIDYKVFKQERHSKKHPEKMDTVWENPQEGEKQQLRFITCLQRPMIGKSVDLVVVFAEQI